MSSIYSPDSWQLVRVRTLRDRSHVIPKDTSAAYYRILAGWSGSYMYGSSWKLSSGCEQVLDEGDNWRVPQSSGSVYVLRKNSERSSAATWGVLERVMRDNPDVKLEIVKMENILGEFGL